MSNNPLEKFKLLKQWYGYAEGTVFQYDRIRGVILIRGSAYPLREQTFMSHLGTIFIRADEPVTAALGDAASEPAPDSDLNRPVTPEEEEKFRRTEKSPLDRVQPLAQGENPADPKVETTNSNPPADGQAQ